MIFPFCKLINFERVKYFGAVDISRDFRPCVHNVNFTRALETELLGAVLFRSEGTGDACEIGLTESLVQTTRKLFRLLDAC